MPSPSSVTTTVPEPGSGARGGGAATEVAPVVRAEVATRTAATA
ncbi:hypothetical protein [Modestobacter marinus]|nr:hypothetical protein [Modestobacter marinus]